MHTKYNSTFFVHDNTNHLDTTLNPKNLSRINFRLCRVPETIIFDASYKGTTLCKVLQAYLSGRLFRAEY
jgi:hypothetical protein